MTTLTTTRDRTDRTAARKRRFTLAHERANDPARAVELVTFAETKLVGV